MSPVGRMNASKGVGILCALVAGDHTVEESMYYFEKALPERNGRSKYGTSPREWLLNAAPCGWIGEECLNVPEALASPEPGIGGWTEPVFFSDELIDFCAHYGALSNHAFYAFCWVEAPRDETAELWISHDEDCAVWLGGTKIYEKAVDRPRSVTLPLKSAADIELAGGRHPLLVKLYNAEGRFESTAAFALNICSKVPVPLPRERATKWDTSRSTTYDRYSGSRVAGLTFDAGFPAGVRSWRME